MNIHAVCFLSVVALATIVVIHNLFLLRRIERLKHGQRCWKAQAEFRKHEADEFYAKLYRAQSREVLLCRMLLRLREKRDWLIAQIWGSPTIVRDFSDVYTIICELHERLHASEATSRDLATVIEKQDAEVKRWQAHANAELATTFTKTGLV